MATKQGMCRNCGSLIIFDERDPECECIFCHCRFPSAEAEAILADPNGHTFANEKFEATNNSKTYYPTSPDIVEGAVKRDKVSEANKAEVKYDSNSFEVSPNDVKAPKKLVIGLSLGLVFIILVVIGIALPLKLNRDKLTNSLNAKMADVFNGIVEVDTSKDSEGFSKGYYIYGQTCQNIKVVVNGEVDKETAKKMFDKYTDLRAGELDSKADKTKDVKMEVYSPAGIYLIEGNKEPEFVKDQPTDAAAETAQSEAK